MKIAYIAHPVSGNVKANLKKIADIVREINLNEPDTVPFVPYYCDCITCDDSNNIERERCIKNNTELFKRKFIDELRLYGDKISRGMSEEIKLARKFGIPVKTMTENAFYNFYNLERS